MDADQGFMQKIFYVHVPIGIVALCGFVFGGVMAIQHLRTGDPKYDLRSYVAIHLSLVLGAGVLITGSIWAKASWGHWWVWDEPTLVSFLIVFLLYATYQPMRFWIEDREKQARYASVFAVTAGAFVPLNFLAVRLAQAYTHPRVFATADGGLPAKMQLAVLPLAPGHGVAVRHALALRDGLQAHLVAASRRCAASSRGDDAVAPVGRTAAPSAPDVVILAQTTPALPDNTGYVAAAYLVFFALVLIYVGDHGLQAGALRARARRAQRAGRPARQRPGGPCRGGRARGGRPTMSELLALGISHKTAPVEVRERLALTEREAERLLRELTAHDEITRGRRDLDVQPHRGLPRRRRPGRRPRPSASTRSPPAPGSGPTELAARRLHAAQLRRRAPALPRRERASSR